MKIILDLCGGTGSWSKPYKEAGFKVINITLPEFDIREHFFMETKIGFKKSKGGILNIPIKDIYGILCAPPCTQFSFAKTTGKPRDLIEAMQIVQACLRIVWGCQFKLKSDYAKETQLKFWALENPNGLLKRFLGRPVMEFNPFDFGDQYQKKTHLWGWFNIPKKNIVKLTKKQKELHKTNSQPLPKFVKFDRLKTKEIASEFYGKLTRQERRAITPQGFAKAFFKANK